MLEELRIRGLGVIDDAVLPIGRGLTVVTGETGAGKTMVITGLLLLFGGRADAARVRSGCDQAAVDGRLELAADTEATRRVIERVQDAGGAIDDDTALVLRRLVAAGGRSRAYVGGAPAPIAVLAELGEQLLAVHGQSDQLRLTRPAQQRAALDRFARLDLLPYAAAHQRWRTAVTVLAERSARLGELRREHDLLSHGIAEIDAADPQPDEDVELRTLASRLAHSDGLRRAARAAHDALLGDPDDPTSDDADVGVLLGRARRELAQQDGDDPALDRLAAQLGELSSLVADLGAELRAYTDELDADPAELARVEARRSVLLALTRKYADSPDAGTSGVLAWAQAARARLGELDVSDEAMLALAAERDAAAAALADLAAEVSAARTEAAGRLARAVTVELAGLALPQAELVIEVRPRPAVAGAPTLLVDGTPHGVGSEGVDEVEFVFRSHPDAPPLPIARGASGGELSRVMLALEVCLAGVDPVPTMVFDEVDAGIGGRAAVEVGRRLARLAADRQVLVVTHLAQVAAYADHHVVVDRPAGGVSSSDIRVVEGEERVRELARMLAGSASDTAREHAGELLAAATGERAVPVRKRTKVTRAKGEKTRS